MTARAKFLFDLDFGGGESAEKAHQTISVAAHEAALAQMQAAAHRDGFVAAETQAVADAQRRSAAALEAIAAAIDRLSQGLGAVEARLEAEAVEVAVAVARKLAPELISREPLAELSALAAECFAHLVTAPHVAVRVSETAYAEAREHLEAIAKARGFGGRLVVLAAPEMNAGDCRIEWADGGILRERAATEATIAEAVNRYIAVRRPAADVK
jgi:flagellar assembly protein FliH